MNFQIQRSYKFYLQDVTRISLFQKRNCSHKKLHAVGKKFQKEILIKNYKRSQFVEKKTKEYKENQIKTVFNTFYQLFLFQTRNKWIKFFL